MGMLGSHIFNTKLKVLGAYEVVKIKHKLPKTPDSVYVCNVNIDDKPRT